MMSIRSTATALLRYGARQQCAASSSWVRSLSSSAAAKTAQPAEENDSRTLVELPPNLRFDRRSKCSPFYNRKPIQLNKQEEDEEEEEEATVEEADDVESKEAKEGEQATEDDVEEEEEGEEEEEEESRLYDLSDFHWEPQKPIYAIPLPERLHVQVLNKLDPNEHVGSLHLDPIIFGQSPVRVDLIKRTYEYQRHKKRGKRYTAKTKGIHEVSGSNKKVRPQKGTGRARAGHKRPPHWRGGARAHGPKGAIHDYTQKLNKKIRKLGLIHLLSQKLLEGNLIVVNDWDIPTHKTNALEKLLLEYPAPVGGGTKGDKVRALLMDAARPKHGNENPEEEGFQGGLPIHLTVASGNLPEVKVQHAECASVWDMLRYRRVIMSVSAITSLEQRLKGVAY